MHCTALFMEAAWWAARGVHAIANTPLRIRPTPTEMAYMVVAKILRPFSDPHDGLSPDISHPLVKELYFGTPGPEYSTLPGSRPAPKRKPSKHDLRTSEDHKRNLIRLAEDARRRRDAVLQKLESRSAERRDPSMLQPPVKASAEPGENAVAAARKNPQIEPKSWLPTEEAVRAFALRLEIEPGVVKIIRPLPKLAQATGRFLPPKMAFYYDEYLLGEVFRSDRFEGSGRCRSCWSPGHAKAMGDCVNTCTVRATNGHLGQTCPDCYVTYSWWRSRGHNVSNLAQNCPKAAEIAYLVLAGIIKAPKKISDLIIPDVTHPLVAKFYGDKEPPMMLKGQARVCSSEDEWGHRGSERAADMQTAATGAPEDSTVTTTVCL